MAGLVRRDSKGRVLQKGEGVEKSGQFYYKYTDASGNRRILRSWRLTSADRTPKGKKDKPPLREQEKELRRLLDMGVVGSDMTVMENCQRYVGSQRGMKYNTIRNYNLALGVLRDERFSGKKITKVTRDDAIAWVQKLHDKGRDSGDGNGLSYSYIKSILSVVRPSFRVAMENDLIPKNPFDFRLSKVIKKDGKERVPLSPEQKESFLGFISGHGYYSRYYDAFYVLFHTGLRISEFCGLTVPDLDFDAGKISVSRQLLYKYGKGCFIETLKTASGKRIIPMMGDVKDCLSRIVAERNTPSNEPVVDGVSGFLFFDENGCPKTSGNWEGHFSHIVEQYNGTVADGCEKLDVTPHVCRHTFCTDMARKGMNPKVLQYIMGHSNISITLDVYTHLGVADVYSEVARIEGMAS